MTHVLNSKEGDERQDSVEDLWDLVGKWRHLESKWENEVRETYLKILRERWELKSWKPGRLVMEWAWCGKRRQGQDLGATWAKAARDPRLTGFCPYSTPATAPTFFSDLLITKWNDFTSIMHNLDCFSAHLIPNHPVFLKTLLGKNKNNKINKTSNFLLALPPPFLCAVRLVRLESLLKVRTSSYLLLYYLKCRNGAEHSKTRWILSTPK